VGTKWALFFGVIMLACAGLFLIAPFVGWWMPEGVSSHAHDVDFLFNIILGITAFFFILTEAILIYFMARFGSGEGQPPAKTLKILQPVVRILDSQHKVEMAWTLVPAAILLYIAFAQVKTWADIKYESHRTGVYAKKGPDGAVLVKQLPVQVDLSARQFEWRMRYPSYERTKNWLDKPEDPEVIKDADRFGRFDAFAHPLFKDSNDVFEVNELHVVKDTPVLVHLSTRDVIHSFNLPQLRVKQDALPGKLIPVWFRPTKANVDENGKIMKDRVWDIPCAELCGWGHARMIGRLFVHETKEDFLHWLKETSDHQFAVPMASAK
jgi:cytochrome c oxidase subunit 2